MTRKILVYDGDCPMCVAASERFVRRGWVAGDACRPFQSFGGEVAARLEAAGIRDGLGVIDQASGEIATGFPALLRLFERRPAPWWARLARLAPVLPVATFAYRVVAANRRALAPPPPRPFPCACDPTPSLLLQGTFVLSCAALFAAGAWIETSLVARFATRGRGGGVPWILLGAEASPWALQAFVAALAPRGALARLASFAWSATLSLYVVAGYLALAAWLGPPHGVWPLWGGLVIRVGFLAYMEEKHRRAPSPVGRRVTISWTGTTAVACAFLAAVASPWQALSP